MSRLLNLSAAVLRSKYIPAALSYQLWQQVSKRSESNHFLFKTRLFGKPMTYGGVCGSSANALFLELESYEAGTIAVLQRVLGPAPVVFDIGANNGMFMMICTGLRPDAEIHCFEPFPDLSSFLLKLIDVNQFERVSVFEGVVGDQVGIGRIHFGEGATDTASCVADFQPFFTKNLEVKQCTIDSYVERTETRPTLLKIDVEGGELEVIRGAHDTLIRYQPDLILELLFPQSDVHRERQKEVIETLRSHGYSFYQIRSEDEMVEQWPVEPDPQYRFINYLVTAKGSKDKKDTD